MGALRFLVLNGPNLDMLGVREPEVYGAQTLGDLEDAVRSHAAERGVGVTCKQSNSEGDLIDIIHDAPNRFDGIVYNPGAHTHYSYALRDAVAAIDIPVVEVHLSDIQTREEFRRISVIVPVCIAQVKGKGFAGYDEAIDLLCGACATDDDGGAWAGEAPDAGEKPARDAIPNLFAPAAPAQSKQTEQPERRGQREEEVDAPGQAVDFTEPFRKDIETADAGMLSYERQKMVADACAGQGVCGLLVRDTSNVRWITAIDGVFDEERAHALLVAGERALLHTDSRYSNALRTAGARIGSDIVVNDERKSHAQVAHDALTDGGNRPLGGKLGIEDTIVYAEFVKMVERFGVESLAATTDLVLKLRAVKDAREVVRLRAAQAVADAAFAHIVGFMRPGMTEREVQLELEGFMLRHGGEGLAFSSIVAAGENGADPHAIPGRTKLQAGQCVVLDFGARAFGYCSDMTRTVFLGRPDGEMARAWETLRRANEQVEAMLRPGVTGAEAHELAEEVLEEGGFGGKMGHGLGHGVGLDVHELPVLSPRNKQPLVPGNVVTVEPGIYLPGKFGMRLEDFGIVTDDGFDVFTQSTHEMVVI